MLFKDRDKEYASGSYEQIVYFAHEGVIRGKFVIYNSHNTERYICDLVIHEEYRNQGYGNLMVAEMVEKYGNKQIPLTLRVLANNLPALHLYQKYGFKITSQEYWGFGNEELVYRMQYEKSQLGEK